MNSKISIDITCPLFLANHFLPQKVPHIYVPGMMAKKKGKCLKLTLTF